MAEKLKLETIPQTTEPAAEKLTSEKELFLRLRNELAEMARLGTDPHLTELKVEHLGQLELRTYKKFRSGELTKAEFESLKDQVTSQLAALAKNDKYNIERRFNLENFWAFITNKMISREAEEILKRKYKKAA